MNHGLAAKAFRLKSRTLRSEGSRTHRDRRDPIRRNLNWWKYELRNTGGPPRIERTTSQNTEDSRGPGSAQKISARNG